MAAATCSVRLIVAKGPRAGMEIAVSPSPFLIGRYPRFHLRPASATVSERHCVIVAVADHLSITDLGSDGGTFVNNVRFQGTVAIGDGDDLRIGPLQFKVRVRAVLDTRADDDTLADHPVDGLVEMASDL
jgi:pSer/pThr/pTyr-binding forkhead associated (FHA) protein